ncbi:PEP-CTERM sorting domain-containing protein [Desulfoluna spongiiphila]|uniref:VPDSG-CTERM protein sorting domain-containing protein n=1 Tax=Desulfoluna spongiiphila TaxID=419481 RepID=A0A1G5ADX9_9BACT|nr:PEP-CTERM sorting domain-containing protein [Desulfoluna spongiiphila]SCX76067.1 VPDSG-CTERM protein sorting domain-containing protein [Desulfoluna spongiiphila]
MRKLFKMLCMAGLMVFLGINGAWAFSIDFEDGVDGARVEGIEGISFLDFSGNAPMYGDSRKGYNTTSDDLGYGSGPFHHNGNMWLWAGSSADARGVKVDFENDNGTWFQTGFSSRSSFYIDAYLTDGTMVTAVAGENSGDPMGFLRVDATAGAFIDYVVLHDSGNMWLVDDMSGDTSLGAPVPEPSTVLLLGLGLCGIAGVRRKKSLRH